MSRRRVLLVVALLLLVPAVALAALVGPYVRDDWSLDHIVRAVALDWRDFGLDTARERLQYELDRQRIGLQVADDDCAFLQPEQGVKVVRCAWQAEVHVPLVARSFPLAFASQARIEPDGDLR